MITTRIDTVAKATIKWFCVFVGLIGCVAFVIWATTQANHQYHQHFHPETIRSLDANGDWVTYHVDSPGKGAFVSPFDRYMWELYATAIARACGLIAFILATAFVWLLARTAYLREFPRKGAGQTGSGSVVTTSITAVQVDTAPVNMNEPPRGTFNSRMPEKPTIGMQPLPG